MDAVAAHVSPTVHEAEQNATLTEHEECIPVSRVEVRCQDESISLHPGATCTKSSVRNTCESKDISLCANVEDHNKSSSADRSTWALFSPTVVTRAEIVALIVVVVIVWGLLALPIVFYHLPSVSYVVPFCQLSCAGLWHLLFSVQYSLLCTFT